MNVVLFTPAPSNPLIIAAATLFAFLFVFRNAIIEGPAPLIVTASAPAEIAFCLTLS
jgi:hypothetical protein